MITVRKGLAGLYARRIEIINYELDIMRSIVGGLGKSTERTILASLMSCYEKRG